ncbi:MAG: 16S rRNA (guanine(966)-N(2))-methyltransferase RsmD [Candidatus Eisenbacteria bacterium]|nr:16S rRNA (guanine(966)-N(2))-methyltransferase RsmD [Candidatus Eisenbacteria bacterium]
MGILRVVAGRWRGRHLSSGPGRSNIGIRPTADRVRTSMFDRLMPVLPDARVLDLCAGTGALGIEALSRGAAHVTFVERSPVAIRLIESNLGLLGLLRTEEVAVRREEVRHAIASLGRARESFDLILADPPYDGGLAREIVQALDESLILASGGWVVVEHDRRKGMPGVAGRLQQLDERIYGDTCLTYYRETRHEDGPISGDL